MKKIKMIVSALAVITVVAAGLAFKSAAFSPAIVFCAASAPNPNAACPAGDLIGYTTTTTGTLTNPCATGQLPYKTTATTCAQFPTGTLFVSTNE